jgi:acetyl esterase/lipase
MKTIFLLLHTLLLSIPPALSQETVTYKMEENILYRSGDLTEYMNERCRLDIYYPENLPDFPTVVWFHGGGLSSGNKYLPAPLQAQGFAIVAVNYRLSPQVNSPAYIEDAAAAVAWVFKNIEQYGGNPDFIFVSGHSAGGYLAAMVGLDKRWLEAHNAEANQLAGILPCSGQTVTHSTVREEKNIPSTRSVVDEFAPAYHARQDAPPLVLITGDRDLDMLARYEENAYLARMMQMADHQKTLLFELGGFDHITMHDPALQLALTHMKNIIDAKTENQ